MAAGTKPVGVARSCLVSKGILNGHAAPCPASIPEGMSLLPLFAVPEFADFIVLGSFSY